MVLDTIESIIPSLFVVLLFIWILLVGIIFFDRFLYDRDLGRVRRALEGTTLEKDGNPSGPELEALRSRLAHLPMRTQERLAWATSTPDVVAQTLAERLVERRGWDFYSKRAQAEGSGLAKWKRIAALRILLHARYPGIVALAEQAIESRDRDVVAAAVAILGRCAEPRSARALIGALERQSYSSSRVATHLEAFPLPIHAELRGLLTASAPIVRFWAVTLLGRYRDVEGLDTEIATLAQDADPRVRKAVAESLGRIGGDAAAPTVLRLLEDDVGFVRAHAARALGELERSDLAVRIAPLLADKEWWVRLAAKEALRDLGPEVVDVVAVYLEVPDRFARNGAAEVLQNLGYLDELIQKVVNEKAEPAEHQLLRKALVAGGAGMVASLAQRDEALAPSRLREIVGELGLEAS